MIHQQGHCIPHNDFNVVMRAAQYVETGSSSAYYLGTLGPLRGVNGWHQAGCVNSGDGQIGVVPYENLKVASDLREDDDETAPYAVTISAAFLP